MPKVLDSSLAEYRERTCTALFQALSELMSQRSFDKIILSDVASHVGVGCTAAYNYFVDKGDLLLVFMERKAGRHAEEPSRALAGTQGPIDRLRIYVRQQVLIARRFRFPTSRPLPGAVSRGTVGRLKAHETLVAQMLSSVLTDAMNQGLIPAQEPERVIPLTHAAVMGGHPTPSDPEQRRAHLESLDAFTLRAVGARQPTHAVPTVAQPRATEPLEGAQALGSLRHSAVG